MRGPRCRDRETYRAEVDQLSTEGPKFRFLPGIPGIELQDEKLNQIAYPDTAADLEKVLRQRGAIVEYSVSRELREEVGHRAADIWLPIIELVQLGGVSVALNLLSNVLYDMFIRKRVVKDSDPQLEESQEIDGLEERSSTPILHLTIERLPDGTARTELNGPAEDVVQAIRELKDKIGDI